MANNEFIEESTVLNFMQLTLTLNDLFDFDYSYEWKDPGYNFYLKRYRLLQYKNKFIILWENLNGDLKSIIYRRPPFLKNFWNNLYFKFFPKISTDDKTHFHNVLMNVIFPHYCKDLELEVDFSDIKSSRESSDRIICYLYKNYFTQIPVNDFLNMFNIDSNISTESRAFMNKCALEGVK